MFSAIQSHRAFTLVELLVVVAILAIMGVSAIVGFGSFGEDIAVQQAGDSVEAIIAQLESEILVEKYESTTVYFEPEHLIAISRPKGSEETLLRWMKEKDMNCPAGQRHIFNTKAGHLTIQNAEDKLLLIKAMPMGGVDCLKFEDSGDSQWQIQLSNAEFYSPIIRFIQFNSNLEKKNEIMLSAQNLRLELQGPYASRKLYENDILLTQPATVTLKSSKTSHSISIQP